MLALLCRTSKIAVYSRLVVHRLQEHIIGYRTSKAKEDCVYLDSCLKRGSRNIILKKIMPNMWDTHDNLISSECTC